MAIDYRAVAAAAAKKYGIPANVFLAQIKQESGFNPNARSPAGAMGIAQIVPKWHPGVDPMNPTQALDYAARMDAQNFAKYHNWQDVLSVYNSGRPWAQGQGIGETRNYVHSILGQAGNVATPVAQQQPVQQQAGMPQQGGVNPQALQALLAQATRAAAQGQVLPNLAQRIMQVRGTGTLPTTPQGPTGAPSAISGQPGTVLGSKYQLIGLPGQGTHSYTNGPNNWQSDRAVDLRVPVGTPVYALENGTIGPNIGPLNSADPRMAGLRTTLLGSDNQFYYAHLSKLAVKAGQRVRKGDLIGYSGSANGVPHLHLGVMSGDPRTYIH